MSQKDKEGILFSTEEMNNIMADTMNFSEDKPETILGMTFKNAEERRAYFREELRKKLPELKKIEGFPIGSDEDILNLSDPPYYTACPNPWLNQFVEEWEKEKTVLENEGKRSKDFEVKEPYAADVKVRKSNPVYVAHTYHTKVPHTAIMHYLMYYTQPGDIVYDGFAGTGMTGVAAQACGDLENQDWDAILEDLTTQKAINLKFGTRHAICGELSPYASMISYNYNTPANAALIKKEVERILDETKKECGWMYTTMHDGKPIGKINCVIWSDVLVCPNCGKEFVYWDAALDKDNKVLKEEFACPFCNTIMNKKNMSIAKETIYDDLAGETISQHKSIPVVVVYTANSKRYERAVDSTDLYVINKINVTPFKTWAPSDKYMFLGEKWGDTWRAGVHLGVTSVNQFYTRRNLLVLSILLDKIRHSSEANKLEFIFSGMINRATKMNRIHINNYFHGGGGWNAGHLKGTLYIPSLPVETSVLEMIEDKMNLYLRAIPMLPKLYDNGLYVGSAADIPLKDNSVDYIFTDPPFGANIMYSELNFLPESWLRVVTNNETEAIVNKSQHKDSLFYLEMMSRCFKEFFRILNYGKWMTVEFSNTNAGMWNIIQQSLNRAGFVTANVSALNKGQGGMRSITTTTAVKQDLAISCYKPSEKIVSEINDTSQLSVWDFMNEHIEHLSPCVPNEGKIQGIAERDQRVLYDRMISFFVQQGLPVPLDAKEFQQGLRERFVERDGMFFTAAQAAEYEEKKKAAPEFVPMGIIVSDEANGIQWLKNQLRNTPKTYQELQPEWMQAINGVRKHDILPELKQLLEENFIEMEDGKWRLPNIQDDVDKEALRTKALLREFKIYVEQASKPKGKIKEARVEALRAGFKDCYVRKDFKTIVMLGDKIPQNLRDEDDVLLQFYDIAQNKI